MDRVKLGVVKISIGIVAALIGGFFIWWGVRDVRLGNLDQMTLVSGSNCCRACCGEFCQEVCDGTKVDPRLLTGPIRICRGDKCESLIEGEDLSCKKLN